MGDETIVNSATSFLNPHPTPQNKVGDVSVAHQQLYLKGKGLPILHLTSSGE